AGGRIPADRASPQGSAGALAHRHLCDLVSDQAAQPGATLPALARPLRRQARAARGTAGARRRLAAAPERLRHCHRQRALATRRNAARTAARAGPPARTGTPRRVETGLVGGRIRRHARETRQAHAAIAHAAPPLTHGIDDARSCCAQTRFVLSVAERSSAKSKHTSPATTPPSTSRLPKARTSISTPRVAPAALRSERTELR